MLTRSCICNLGLSEPIGGESALPRQHVGILSIATYATSSGVPVEVIDVDEIASTDAASPCERLDLHFHDADFLGPSTKGITRARKIAELLIARKLYPRVRIACQASSAAKAGVDFWRLWLRAGLLKVFVGYESGVEEDLRFYRKPSRVKDNLAAWRVLRTAGVPTQAGFIMYNPYSSLEGVAANLTFLRRIDQAHVFKHVASSLEVYPGTAVYETLRALARMKCRSRWCAPFL